MIHCLIQFLVFQTYYQPQQQLNSEFIITPQLTTSHDFMFKFKVEVWKTIYTYNQPVESDTFEWML